MTKIRKRMLALTALATGGILFQNVPGLPGGCVQLAGTGLVAGFDFCAVINCSSGTFFDFCDDNSIFVLVDCPTTAATP